MRGRMNKKIGVVVLILTFAFVFGPAWKAYAPCEHALTHGFKIAAINPLLKGQGIVRTPSLLEKLKTRKV